MPQLADMILKDHLAANHTFKPRGVVDGIATLVESTGVPIGDRRVSFAQQRTTTGRHKATVRFVVPIVQNTVVNGISKPAVVRTSYVDMTFTFDGASSADERADVLWFAYSFLENANAFAYIRDLESFY